MYHRLGVAHKLFQFVFRQFGRPTPLCPINGQHKLPTSSGRNNSRGGNILTTQKSWLPMCVLYFGWNAANTSVVGSTFTSLIIAVRCVIHIPPLMPPYITRWPVDVTADLVQPRTATRPRTVFTAAIRQSLWQRDVRCLGTCAQGQRSRSQAQLSIGPGWAKKPDCFL